MIQIPHFWHDYELIDFGGQEKLERLGNFTIRRPDQNAVGTRDTDIKDWSQCDMEFKRISKDEGKWNTKNTSMPDKWPIKYFLGGNVTNPFLGFWIKPTKYKHLGLFPEQAVNWEWIIKTIQNDLKNDSARQIRVLNLFGYTGGSSLASSLAGSREVVHVDSSKSANILAKENQKLSGLDTNIIRIITEDVRKFVSREIKRGNKYDAIIMDPPLYGRGPIGELWKIDTDLLPLIDSCMELLSSNPLFFIVNLYAGNNLEKAVVKKLNEWSKNKQFDMQFDVKSLGLAATKSRKTLQCGEIIRCYDKSY